MSKSPEQQASYAARHELRLRRDKAAIMLMPFYLESWKGLQEPNALTLAAVAAVAAADELLAQLDATRKDRA